MMAGNEKTVVVGRVNNNGPTHYEAMAVSVALVLVLVMVMLMTMMMESKTTFVRDRNGEGNCEKWICWTTIAIWIDLICCPSGKISKGSGCLLLRLQTRQLR